MRLSRVTPAARALAVVVPGPDDLGGLPAQAAAEPLQLAVKFAPGAYPVKILLGKVAAECADVSDIRAGHAAMTQDFVDGQARNVLAGAFDARQPFFGNRRHELSVDKQGGGRVVTGAGKSQDNGHCVLQIHLVSVGLEGPV
jgi:hypothetical protein